jgi:protein required for attachment to host cells
MLHVVVADTAEARIYASGSRGGPMTRVRSLDNPSAHRPERELVSSAPGRVFNRSSGARQALAPREEHREVHLERFARTIAREIGASLKRAECEDVALVAPPRVLSLIRSALPASLRRHILLEIPKDLVHGPVTAVRREVRAALGLAQTIR